MARIAAAALIAGLGMLGEAPVLAQETEPEPADPIIVPVRTIEPTDKYDDDLAPIIEAIGDARVVALGEASAGDGATLLAKCRLVRHLHKEHGFDLLVWETGMYDATLMDNAYEQGDDVFRAVSLGLGPEYVRSGHIAPILDYAWESYFFDGPLRMAGIDPLSVSDQSSRRWPVEFLDMLDELEPSPVAPETRAGLRTLLVRGDAALAGEDEPEIFNIWLELSDLSERFAAIQPTLERELGADRVEFWSRTLEDRLIDFETRMTAAAADLTRMNSDNERQRRMGDNLVWLAKQVHPDRKIIVWCDTWSMLARPEEIGAAPRDGAVGGAETAGQTWRAALGDELYSIAFTSAKGKTGPAGQDKEDAVRARPGSIEDLLAAPKAPFVFADLTRLPADHQLRDRRASAMAGVALRMRARGDLGDDELVLAADWSRQVDAVFLSRRMFPSSGDGDIPLGADVKDRKFRDRGALDLPTIPPGDDLPPPAPDDGLPGRQLPGGFMPAPGING